MPTSFPFLVNDPAFYDVFKNVTENLPPDVEVYILGGSMRNAMMLHYHNETLQQRDYDQIVTAKYDDYISFLRSIGFVTGGIDRADQLILSYDLVPNADPTSYDDSVVFDMHPMEGTDPAEVLMRKANFTINGFALSIRDIYLPNWIDKVIALPSAVDDIRAKRLRLNPTGVVADAADIFACLRFMSVGFTPPPKEEIALLLTALQELPSDRFERNLPKLFRYVGGEAKARELIAMLGVHGDLLDESQVRAGLVTV